MESLNEKRLIAKRKYTEIYPTINMSTYAPIRNKVLTYISEKGYVTEEELTNFFNTLKEELSSKTTLKKWIRRNKSLISERMGNGLKTFRLTVHGNRILSKMKKYEELKESQSSNLQGVFLCDIMEAKNIKDDDLDINLKLPNFKQEYDQAVRMLQQEYDQEYNKHNSSFNLKMTGVFNKYLNRITILDNKLDKFDPTNKKQYNVYMKEHKSLLKNALDDKKKEEDKHTAWFNNKTKLLQDKFIKNRAKVVLELRKKYY